MIITDVECLLDFARQGTPHCRDKQEPKQGHGSQTFTFPFRLNPFLVRRSGKGRHSQWPKQDCIIQKEFKLEEIEIAFTDMLKIFSSQLPSAVIRDEKIKKLHLLCTSQEQCECMWVCDVVIIIIQTHINYMLNTLQTSSYLTLSKQPYEVDLPTVVFSFLL